MSKKASLLLILSLAFMLDSCFIVKRESSKIERSEVNLSEKPEIEMGDKMVRSDKGDMISFIPKDWFFLDTDNKTNEDVFAIAVNPDYSLSAVFSKMKSSPTLDKHISNDDLIQIAKTSFEMQKRKSNRNLEILGNFSIHTNGQMNFVSYQVSTTKGALISNIAVFKSDFGNVYRLALIPMDVIGKPIPRQSEIDKIFNSILATIKY